MKPISFFGVRVLRMFRSAKPVTIHIATPNDIFLHVSRRGPPVYKPFFITVLQLKKSKRNQKKNWEKHKLFSEDSVKSKNVGNVGKNGHKGLGLQYTVGNGLVFHSIYISDVCRSSCWWCCLWRRSCKLYSGLTGQTVEASMPSPSFNNISRVISNAIRHSPVVKMFASTDSRRFLTCDFGHFIWCLL